MRLERLVSTERVEKALPTERGLQVVYICIPHGQMHLADEVYPFVPSSEESSVLSMQRGQAWSERK